MFALTPNKNLVNQITKVQFFFSLTYKCLDLAKIMSWQGRGSGKGVTRWGIGCAWCPHGYWLNSTKSESLPLVTNIISMKLERNWNSSRCPTGSSKFQTPSLLVDERQLFIIHIQIICIGNDSCLSCINVYFAIYPRVFISSDKIRMITQDRFHTR